MVKLTAFSIALILSMRVLAGEQDTQRTVDLRIPHALENLQQTDPTEFDKIQQIVVALKQQPERAEGDWLRVKFAARDVDLSRYLLKTSNPPKQLLRFTLDDVRYIMYVTRSDLTATVKPAL